MANNKDTVEVIVFDPHETDSPMGQDGREGPLLLFVHQKGHEVLDLWHVHISSVISAHQDLLEIHLALCSNVLHKLSNSVKWQSHLHMGDN